MFNTCRLSRVVNSNRVGHALQITRLPEAKVREKMRDDKISRCSSAIACLLARCILVTWIHSASVLQSWKAHGKDELESQKRAVEEGLQREVHAPPFVLHNALQQAIKSCLSQHLKGPTVQPQTPLRKIMFTSFCKLHVWPWPRS